MMVGVAEAAAVGESLHPAQSQDSSQEFWFHTSLKKESHHRGVSGVTWRFHVVSSCLIGARL